MKSITIETPLPWNGGNAPTCPECGSGNAMLDHHGRRPGNWDDKQCRDCGLIVLVDEKTAKVTNPYADDDGATPGRLGKAWQRGHDGGPPSKSWVRGRDTWNAYQEGRSAKQS